jgi:hypothetical protein
MGEDEKERSLEGGWILFVKLYLTSEIVPGVIEGMDFIQPERLLVKAVESQGESNDDTKNKDEPFLLLSSVQALFHRRSTGQAIPFSSGDLGS